MLDFKNGSVFKLKKLNKPVHASSVHPILIGGEDIISEYAAVRDYVVFTTKRIIAVNVQGITGAKQDFTSLPYSKIQAFSIETSGTFDLDSELEIYFSGLGKVKFEFKGMCDIKEIGRLISEFALK